MKPTRQLLTKIVSSRSKVASTTTSLSSRSSQLFSDVHSKACTPADLIASLRPMKRILCLCPVPLPLPIQAPDTNSKQDGSKLIMAKDGDIGGIPMHMHMNDSTTSSYNGYGYGNDNGSEGHGGAEYERYEIGMAISDPYLSYAIPINVRYISSDRNNELENKNKDNNLRSCTSLLIRKGYDTKTNTNTTSATSTRTGTCTRTNNEHENITIMWENLPPTAEEFLREHVGHHDVGALVLGLPLKQRDLTLPTGFDAHDDRMIHVRHIMHHIVRNLRSKAPIDDDNKDNDDGSHKEGSNDSDSDSKIESREKEEEMTMMATTASSSKVRSVGPLDLQCYVEDHLTLAEARKFALEEPEMWEGIDLNGSCSTGYGYGYGTEYQHQMKSEGGATRKDEKTVNGEESIICPSVHAATALNAFLWRHTGGWRNTFA